MQGVFLGFPVSSDGLIVIDTNIYPELSPAVIASRLRDMLAEAKASHIAVDGDAVEFSNRFFRLVSIWNILFSYDAGRFIAAPGDRGLEVRYTLSTRRQLRTIMAMVGVLGAAFLAAALVTAISDVPGTNDIAENAPIMAALLIFFGLWVFGMNYLFARMRMPGWLKDGLIY